MSLINKAQVKRYALDIAAQKCPPQERAVVRGGQQVRVVEPKFIQVSSDFYVFIESHLKEKIRSYIHTMPSVGRTIK